MKRFVQLHCVGRSAAAMTKLNKCKAMDCSKVWNERQPPTFAFIQGLLAGLQSTNSLSFGIVKAAGADGQMDFSADCTRRPMLCQCFNRIARACIDDGAELNDYNRIVVTRHQVKGESSLKCSGHGINGTGVVVFAFRGQVGGNSAPVKVFQIDDVGKPLIVVDVTAKAVFIPPGAAYGFAPAWGADGKEQDDEVISVCISPVRPVTALPPGMWAKAKLLGFMGAEPNSDDRGPYKKGKITWPVAKANATLLYNRFVENSRPGYKEEVDARRLAKELIRKRKAEGYCINCSCPGCEAKTKTAPGAIDAHGMHRLCVYTYSLIAQKAKNRRHRNV